jgi:hypothetical protein
MESRFEQQMDKDLPDPESEPSVHDLQDEFSRDRQGARMTKTVVEIDVSDESELPHTD